MYMYIIFSNQFYFICSSNLQHIFHTSAFVTWDARHHVYCVGILVDYLLLKLHGVVAWEYETIFHTNCFIINSKITPWNSYKLSSGADIHIYIYTYTHTYLHAYIHTHTYTYTQAAAYGRLEWRCTKPDTHPGLIAWPNAHQLACLSYTLPGAPRLHKHTTCALIKSVWYE